MRPFTKTSCLRGAENVVTPSQVASILQGRPALCTEHEGTRARGRPPHSSRYQLLTKGIQQAPQTLSGNWLQKLSKIPGKITSNKDQEVSECQLKHPNPENYFLNTFPFHHTSLQCNREKKSINAKSQELQGSFAN